MVDKASRISTNFAIALCHIYNAVHFQLCKQVLSSRIQI
jgi:hypothetical protein